MPRREHLDPDRILPCPWGTAWEEAHFEDSPFALVVAEEAHERVTDFLARICIQANTDIINALERQPASLAERARELVVVREHVEFMAHKLGMEIVTDVLTHLSAAGPNATPEATLQRALGAAGWTRAALEAHMREHVNSEATVERIRTVVPGFDPATVDLWNWKPVKEEEVNAA